MLKIAFAVLLGATAGAQGAFNLRSVDVGIDYRSFGGPIYTTTAFFQHSFGNNYPSSAPFINLIPDLRWDTYIAMDPNGPSTATYTAAGPGGSTPGGGSNHGHFYDDYLTGGWFTGGGVEAATGDPFGGHGVMIAQLSVYDDGTLSSNSVRIAIEEDDAILSLDLVLNGEGSEGVFVRSILTHDDVVVPDGVIDVHEVWVTDIPAPAALPLLIATAFVRPNRRRR